MKTFLIAVAAFVGMLDAADAQTSRAYAMRGGSGSTCTQSAPCASLLDAVVALPSASGGIVQLLSPGYFGNVNAPGTASYHVEGAGTGTVINGFGLQGTGQTGIVNALSVVGGSLDYSSSAGSFTIEDVRFSQNGVYGVYFIPKGPASVVIRNSTFERSSTGTGAAIRIVTNGHNVNVSLDNVKVSGGIRGIVIDTTGGGWAKVNIENSSFTNIIGPAIYGVAGSGNIRLYLDRVTATNSNVGVVMAGANAMAWMTQSKIAGNATGIQQAGGAKIYSYKNNYIFNNTTDGTPLPTSPTPVQSVPSSEIASAVK